MRLHMLKHCVGKGRHIMKPLHVCLIVLQYYAIVATWRAGYVLYRALVVVVVVVGTKIARSRVLGVCACCKHNQSVDIGEKMVCMRFEFLKKAY